MASNIYSACAIAFSALMLLVGCQEEHLDRKNLMSFARQNVMTIACRGLKVKIKVKVMVQSNAISRLRAVFF